MTRPSSSKTVLIKEAVVLFNVLVLDGGMPPAPFVDCGPDPTDVDLHCD